MKKKTSKMIKNQKGFSLVELLVAITILAIIVLPFLNSFVTATKTNTKARKKMEATTAAQNVMEEVKVADVEQLKKEGNFEYDDTLKKWIATYKPSDATALVKDLKSLDGLNINGNKYWARVTFDANAYKKEEDETDKSLNDHKIANISDMDVLQDGFYVQYSEQDLTYAKAIVTQIKSETNRNVSDETVLRGMTRKVTININSMSGGNLNFSEVNVIYEYKYNGGYDQVYTTTIYDNSDVKNGTLRSVYLFYNPLYTSIAGDVKDEIVINNNLNTGTEDKDATDVTVYLVKQTTGVLREGIESIAGSEAGYRVKVSINEPTGHDDSPVTKLRSNIGWSIYKDNTTGEYPSKSEQLVLSYKRGSGAALSGKDAKDMLSYTSLGAEETKERIYGVTVEIFSSEDLDENNKILTYTGSKTV